MGLAGRNYLWVGVAVVGLSLWSWGSFNSNRVSSTKKELATSKQIQQQLRTNTEVIRSFYEQKAERDAKNNLVLETLREGSDTSLNLPVPRDVIDVLRWERPPTRASPE